MFTEEFKAFIRDYESGFKGTADVVVGVMMGLGDYCRYIKPDEIKSPNAFRAILINTEAQPSPGSAENKFIEKLLAAAPVDKDKHLYWRRHPVIEGSEGLKSRIPAYRIWARLYCRKEILISNEEKEQGEAERLP